MKKRFEDARLIDLYRQTRSVQKAAQHAGCSPTTVHKALVTAGILRRDYCDPSGRGRHPVGIPYAKRKSSGYVVWVVRHWDGKKRVYAELMEHRLVMEMILGRPLTGGETVHHRNGVRWDNAESNLELRVGPHGTGATHCPHCGGNISIHLERT